MSAVSRPMFLSAAIVLRMYGPTVTLSMSSTGIVSTPASTSALSVPPETSPSLPISQVSSSPASAKMAPLVSSTRSRAANLPTIASNGTRISSTLPSSRSSFAFRGEILAPASNTTSPVAASTTSIAGRVPE